MCNTNFPFYVSCEGCNRLAVYAETEQEARQKARAAGFTPGLGLSVYRFDPYQIPAYCTGVIGAQIAA